MYDKKDADVSSANNFDGIYRFNFSENHFEDALESAKESLEFKLQNAFSSESLDLSYFNLAQVYDKLGDINSAKENIDKIGSDLEGSLESLKQNIYEQILPCCLKRLKIENYHGIKLIELDNLPINSQWIFLTGENGYGKTSILQALVIGLFGSTDKDRILCLNDTKIEVEYLQNYNTKTNKLFSDDFETSNFIACYGSSRLNLKEKKGDEKSTITYNIFKTDGLLEDIQQVLIESYGVPSEETRYQEVRGVLLKLLAPYISDIKIEKKNGQNIVIYYETVSDDTKLTWDELASGYKAIIALVGDLLIRFMQYGANISSPENITGIVFIDELELYLHPKWQTQLVSLLSKNFPKIQFVVSTHSVIPILGAPENSLFLKVERNKQDGIKLINLSEQGLNPINLSPNIILTSPLFESTSISINNKNFASYKTHNNWWELQREIEIDRELNEGVETQFFLAKINEILEND